MSAGGVCEASVTSRTRCGLYMCRECGELLVSMERDFL